MQIFIFKFIIKFKNITYREMKYAELIEKCDECIKTFNPVISTIDSHADTYLVTVKDPYEKVFIK